MARPDPALRDYVKSRWGPWLAIELEDRDVTPTKLAAELYRRRFSLDGSNSAIHDSANRSVVRNWLRGGFATPESAFATGQILGKKSAAVDGLQALWACGHYGPFVALALELIERALRGRTKPPESPAEDDAQRFRLEYPLRCLAGVPIAFAKFDGVDSISSELCANVRDTISNARCAQDRQAFFSDLDDAWASRNRKLSEWATLFEWAAKQTTNYREATLVAWHAVIGSVSARARHDEFLFLHWRNKEQWFIENRSVLMNSLQSR